MISDHYPHPAAWSMPHNTENGYTLSSSADDIACIKLKCSNKKSESISRLLYEYDTLTAWIASMQTYQCTYFMVQRRSFLKIKNCAFCDKSTKYGTHLENCMIEYEGTFNVTFSDPNK